MTAREMLANLTNLTLAGYEDGEYLWIGTRQQWNSAKLDVWLEVPQQIYQIPVLE